MDRFHRQELIKGWDQKRIGQACVAVYGRDWLGTFLVWALASMGVGTVLWLGRSRHAPNSLANWLLSHPSPFSGSTIHDYPFDVEYGCELDWVLGSSSIQIFVCTTEYPLQVARCRAASGTTKWLAGITARGGWVGSGEVPHFRQPNMQDTSVAMILAAVLADAVRESICPLSGGSLAEGALGFRTLGISRPETALLIGVGGIGVYAATALAASGVELHLVDFDRVEDSNLNRQGLFTHSDAEKQTYKAAAAKHALARIFPEARVSACLQRVTAEYSSAMARLNPKPTAILSAVDNAVTRLVIQSLGREHDLPVIQGGTDLFVADCFTQEPGGPLFDEQMHGTLSAAASREASRNRPGSCAAEPSYVVPGMIAGALMAYRFLRVCTGGHGLRAIHWRSGNMPVEHRSLKDVFYELTAESS